MKILKQLIGKTIKVIEKELFDDGYPSSEEITIFFTDGTELTLTSWDSESYSSGIRDEIKWKKIDLLKLGGRGLDTRQNA